MSDNQFINNLQDYLRILTLGHFDLFKLTEKGDDGLEPLDFLVKYKDEFAKHNILKHIHRRLTYSLYLLLLIETEKSQNNTLNSIAKERKNIKNIYKFLNTATQIFNTIKDNQTLRKLQIIEKVFELFEKDDKLTIKLLCTAGYISSIIESGYADFETVKARTPELIDIVNDSNELSFIGSLMSYFDGYRLTPDMFSLASNKAF